MNQHYMASKVVVSRRLFGFSVTVFALFLNFSGIAFPTSQFTVPHVAANPITLRGMTPGVNALRQGGANPSPTPDPSLTPTANPGVPYSPVLSSINNVFLIVMETYSWAAVKSYPYVGGILINDPQAAYATQYFKPPPTVLLSEPQYLWLEAGTDFGIMDDLDPGVNAQTTPDHLATLLNNVGISWRAYQEDISGLDCPVVDSGLYAVRHNPFMYFTDVTGNLAYCISHVRPYTELSNDLQNGTVARYNFITPNLCDDSHDNCTGDPVSQGDNWLSTEVPKIMNSDSYRDRGTLIITWDNSDASASDPIGLIVLSPFSRGGGYHNSIYYTHSSTLLTLQEIFGTGPLLGDAVNATDLSDLFQPSPSTVTPGPTTGTGTPTTTDH